MPTITGLDDFPTDIATLPMPLADGRSAIACVHQPTPGSGETAYSAAYLLNSLNQAAKVGQSEPFGKDIGCSLELRGTVLRLYVTEPPPGGGGAASLPNFYDIQIGVGYPAAPGGGVVDGLVRSCLRAVRQALVPLG